MWVLQHHLVVVLASCSSVRASLASRVSRSLFKRLILRKGHLLPQVHVHEEIESRFERWSLVLSTTFIHFPLTNFRASRLQHLLASPRTTVGRTRPWGQSNRYRQQYDYCRGRSNHRAQSSNPYVVLSPACFSIMPPPLDSRALYGDLEGLIFVEGLL